MGKSVALDGLYKIALLKHTFHALVSLLQLLTSLVQFTINIGHL